MSIFKLFSFSECKLQIKESGQIKLNSCIERNLNRYLRRKFVRSDCNYALVTYFDAD